MTHWQEWLELISLRLFNEGTYAMVSYETKVRWIWFYKTRTSIEYTAVKNNRSRGNVPVRNAHSRGIFTTGFSVSYPQKLQLFFLPSATWPAIPPELLIRTQHTESGNNSKFSRFWHYIEQTSSIIRLPPEYYWVSENRPFTVYINRCVADK